MIILGFLLPILVGYAIFETFDLGSASNSETDVQVDMPEAMPGNTASDLTDMLVESVNPAGLANDTVDEGGGENTAAAPPVQQSLLGDLLNNILTGTDGADTILGRGGDDTLSGGAGSDSINGGDGADVLNGGEGDDLLEGRDGNDTAVGNNGNDVLFGGDGNDSLNGAVGNDVAFGGSGDDTIEGQAGSDTLSGEDGNDTLLGGADNDVLIGGSGNDDLRGAIGDDIIGGDSGSDLLVGEDGNDTLLGNAARDIISAGAGNDLLVGGDGNDSLDGGAGNDTIISGASNFFLTTSGTVDWTADMRAAFLALEASDPALAVTGTASQIFASTPFDGVDTSSATNPVSDIDPDFLNGGSGNDALFLEDGDTAEGGSGLDSFFLNGDSAVNHVITINDFAPTDDTIVVQHASSVPAPTLSVADNGADADIFIDGNIIASVLGAAGVLTTSDVSLVSVNRATP